MERGDGNRISGLRRDGTHTPYLFIKQNKEDFLQESEREHLLRRLRELRECKQCSEKNVINDIEIYVIPYLNLLEKYSIVLISDDRCLCSATGLLLKERAVNYSYLAASDLKDEEKILKTFRLLFSSS